MSLNMEEEVPVILIQCPTQAESGGNDEKKSEIMPMNNEEAFAYTFLDLHSDFYISDLKQDSVKVPLGLELFSTMTRLKVTKREIVPDDDLNYRAFCQYDISDDNQVMHIAIGLEKTDPWAVRCFQDSRFFNVHIYDYVCERILSIHRRFTWSHCLIQYSCIGWIFGLNGCGNYVEVFDSRDILLGHIKQCPFYTKRLVYQSEPLKKSNNKFRIIPSPAHKSKLSSFLRNIRQIWRDRKVKKFDVINNISGGRKIRIEQYIRDGNTFKFILMDQMFNAGYVRKCSENEYTIIIWKYFDETDKALLLASSFLFDHIKFHVSLEGTYMKVHEMKYKEQFKTSRTTCIPRSCQYNRCRRALYFLSLTIFLALPIVLLIFL